MMSGTRATSKPAGNGQEFLMSGQKARFDFAAFKDAFESRDAQRWAQFYAEEAEWIEY